MATSFKLQAIITGIDHLTPMLKKIAKQTRGFKAEFARAGRGAIPMAAGLGAAILAPAKAFADLENASVQLQNTLMRAGGGVPATFAEINKQAIELGNVLPGSTADFAAMASSLNALGVSAETISGGALKATAYLGVVGKPLGVTYEQAAEAIGKLSNAMGIADKDLVPFADTLQRTLHMGVNLGDMQYAMSRAAGALKPLGKQGLAAANELIPLNALLIQSGVSGEEAGTGIKKIISVLAMHGKFKGIPEMVKSLEKLGKLAPAKQLATFKAMFGEEHAAKAAIIAAGGYDKLTKAMEEQASMEERVRNSLGTLTNLWEAATGTATNAGAAIASAYAPELKSLTMKLNDGAASIQAWAEQNKSIIKGALLAAGGIVGFKLAAYGASIALSGLNALMSMSPLGLLIRALAVAAPLIAANWDTIVGAFKSGIAEIERIINLVKPNLDALIDSTKSFSSHFMPSAGGMPFSERELAARDKQRNLIRSAKSASGELSVNFNNAPAGMRVSPGTNVGGIRISPNVGYRSFATGMP